MVGTAETKLQNKLPEVNTDTLKQLNLETLTWMISMATTVTLCLLPPELQAADPVKVNGSGDFSEIYGRLVGWIIGDLGRTLSISFVLIGFATGVGAAVGLQVTPTIQI